MNRDEWILLAMMGLLITWPWIGDAWDYLAARRRHVRLERRYEAIREADRQRRFITHDLFVMPDGSELWTHQAKVCVADPACVVHRPSNHHMRDMPMHWRSDRGQMERICEHGVGHPDPDDLAFHLSKGRDYMGVHGCCGCCDPTGMMLAELASCKVLA